MNQYPELLVAFQVGSRRAQLPDLELGPNLPGASPEGRLLLQAASAGLMLKAGAKAITGAEEFKSAPDEVRAVSHKSEAALVEAFSLELPRAVLEWATAAAKSGLVAPHRALPALVGLAKRNPGVIVPILGTRGLWLAEILGVALDEAESDEFPKRRTEDPVAYRKWLTEEFSNMEFDERRRAISALREQTELEDEPLLEVALKDRRKEVRTIATEILARLEGSQVFTELESLADRALQHEKSLLRERLVIELPETEGLPKWLPTRPTTDQSGLKAAALCEILALVPPHHWQERFRVSARRFFELAVKNDFARTLMDGVTRAAVQFSDQEWIDESFVAFHRGSSSHVTEWCEMARFVSEPVFDSVLIQFLRQNKKWSHPVLYSLYHRGRMLSPRLTTAVIENFQPGILGELFNEIFYLLDPFVASNADLDTPETQNLSEANREKGKQIIPLRQRLLSSLLPQTS